MQDITWLIDIVFTVIGLVLVRYAVPWLKKKAAAIDSGELDYWVGVAVMASEEAYKNMAGAGSKKMAEAVTFLRKKGYTVDEEQLQTTIRAKVRELFNFDDYGHTADNEKDSEEAIE